jgi:PAS domain S-box-containing protein
MRRTASSPLERIDEDKALRLVVEGTAHETGEAFFRALVRNLSAALQVPLAWVSEWRPTERRLRAIAFWCDDHFIEGYEYEVDGTPCQPVIEGACLAHFPDRIVELFPDPDLEKLHAVSYLGAPFLDTDGTLLGHLSVMDRRPMPPEPRLFALFAIFAARAAAEYRRLRIEAEVRAQREQLGLLIESAMDGIVVMDADLRIAQVNPAAVRVFGCTAEDLVGENLRDFLAPASAAVLEALAQKVASLPELDRKLWLPEAIEARRWDRQPFPIEGTFSCYQFRGAVFYTLMLRDANERLEWERRIRALTEETEYLREVIGDAPGEMGLVGRSAGARGVCHAIRQVAPTDATVLVLGETGTGKELVARAIHDASARRDKRLVRVNCAAIPETLIESEFFGHEKGAFTGAATRREGRFAQADGGTLFLDEVGELPLDLQAKLLRVLQEGEFEPLGSERTQKVNVRVVAATNRRLEDEIAAGRFREDLYYRLNVFPIRLPPLRERGDDIALLAETFVARFAQRMGRRFDPLDEDALRLLRGYTWPGNVRELQNVIERALILSPDRRIDLARALPTGAIAADLSPTRREEKDTRILTAAELEELERTNLRRALEAVGWKISGADGAAARLGLPASTVSSRMKALGLSRPG